MNTGSAIAVMAGAMLGALLRWRIGILFNLPDGVLNWGTLLVNVGGSAIAGAVFAWHQTFPLPSLVWLFLVVGFLGGLTTFSAYSMEFISLLNKGEIAWAICHAAIHVVLSLIAVSLTYYGFTYLLKNA